MSGIMPVSAGLFSYAYVLKARIKQVMLNVKFFQKNIFFGLFFYNNISLIFCQ